MARKRTAIRLPDALQRRLEEVCAASDRDPSEVIGGILAQVWGFEPAPIGVQLATGRTPVGYQLDTNRSPSEPLNGDRDRKTTLPDSSSLNPNTNSPPISPHGAQPDTDRTPVGTGEHREEIFAASEPMNQEALLAESEKALAAGLKMLRWGKAPKKGVAEQARIEVLAGEIGVSVGAIAHWLDEEASWEWLQRRWLEQGKVPDTFAIFLAICGSIRHQRNLPRIREIDRRQREDNDDTGFVVPSAEDIAAAKDLKSYRHAGERHARRNPLSTGHTGTTAQPGSGAGGAGLAAADREPTAGGGADGRQ